MAATPSGSSPTPSGDADPDIGRHRRRGGDPRGVPHRVGRAGRAGRAHVGTLGARPRRRVRCRHGGDPDRQGDRCPGRRHLLARQGRGVPRARCRSRARTQPGRLARRTAGGRTRRGRRRARRDRWRRGRPEPPGDAARRHHRAGRVDGRRQHRGQRRPDPPEADHVDRHHAAERGRWNARWR